MKECTKKHLEAKIVSYQQAIRERFDQIAYLKGLIAQIEKQMEQDHDK